MVAKKAMARKNISDLLLASLIYNTCRFPSIASNGIDLYERASAVFGRKLVNFMVQHTFFTHFCGGESVEAVKSTIAKLKSDNVGGILDYAVERAGAADENLAVLLEEIQAVHDLAPDGYAAVKVTALGDLELLKRMSTILVEIKRFYARIANPTVPVTFISELQPFELEKEGLLPPSISWENFQKGWDTFFVTESEEQVRAEFERHNPINGQIDLINWMQSFSLVDLANLTSKCKETGPLARSMLTESELKDMTLMLDRLETLMEKAYKLNVRVLVDAEFYSTQPAINHVVLNLQRKYNKTRPIVNNTYQCYLKGMDRRVDNDLQRSIREGWFFGGKIVRGAYMVSEAQEAASMNRASPILGTKETTDQMYDSIAEMLITHPSKPEFMMASHNVESCVKLAEMADEESAKRISFGQLYGMADHLTFYLAEKNLKVYKYIPYGPVDEVIPYLIRRAQENSSILGGPNVVMERKMVSADIFRRLKYLFLMIPSGCLVFYWPSSVC